MSRLLLLAVALTLACSSTDETTIAPPGDTPELRSLVLDDPGTYDEKYWIAQAEARTPTWATAARFCGDMHRLSQDDLGEMTPGCTVVERARRLARFIYTPKERKGFQVVP